MPASADVQSLIGAAVNTRWNMGAPVGTQVVVTYSFPQVENAYGTGGVPGFQGFGAGHIAHIETALATWEDAAGISFVRVPNRVGGDLQFAMLDMTGYTNSVGNQVSGWGYYPQWRSTSDGTGTVVENTYRNIGGDVFLNANFYAAAADSIAPGIRGYSILLHEIGHAIGFKHPFEGDPVIDAAHDNGSYTVMSYTRSQSTTTLGSVDIEALRYLYGTHDPAGRWVPKYKAVEQSGSRFGEWLLGSEINDILRAGRGNDQMLGRDGRDRLFGQGDNDTLAGQEGRDLLVGGGGRDRFVFQAGDGRDTIRDFADDTDTLRLDESLWGGGSSVQEMLDTYGSVRSGKAVLSFDGGDRVVLDGITDLDLLVDDIAFI